MRETRTDTTLAILVALGLHALILAALLLGLQWSRPQADAAAGEPVTAELVDPNALSAATRRALANPRAAEPTPPPTEPEAQAPPPQPLPSPVPEDAPVPRQAAPQAPLPTPDTREQERVDRAALAAETAAREQEEKHRQQQVDLTEQRRQQQEAEQKRRLAQQQEQAERDRQLAEIRKQREKAARDAQLAEQKLRQIADARSRNPAEAAAQADAAASAPPGNRGVDEGLLARYRAALQAAIAQNWTRPDSVPLGQRCKIVIRQLPGGEVIDAKVDPSCPYDAAGQRSIEAAVLKAQPLPYAGFEPVFARTLIVNFEAQDR